MGNGGRSIGLTANPGNGSDSGAERCDEKNDHDDQKHPGPANVVAFDLKGAKVDRDVRERYSSNDQADRHAKNGDQENLAAAEPVHDKQVDEREDEVGGGDSDGNSGGVAESDNFEQGGAVVHECAKKMH